ncbi:DMT family transporter [Erythrobacter dokdonensis]|uniref:Putative permease, DMT superfamily n=1 Tax=Erythrobacter dokdonensis DSW-74 TaxID=1300349 RepID=A0A1A7BFK7_9SPHN|nr:DMT family transporter [Erythrobacter dokdonensis]OBV11274.1 putative permease, DMT superfamily [Erythrobacter dokdonensis DSW-74]
MENEGAAQGNLVGEPARPAAWLLLLALLGGNVALAIGPWFVRVADTGPVAAGFWRLFLALPFLVLLARANGQHLTGMGTRTLGLVALGAVTFALDLASWHTGIGMTRLGNAVLFGNAGSVVLLFWVFIAHRVLPRPLEWLAIIFALAGAAILMGRSLEISPATLLGDVFCLAAGLLYAVYLLTLQGARGASGSWSLLVWVSIFGCPVLLAIALALGEPVWPADWRPILGLFILSQLVGQGLMVYSLKYFSPLVVGLALLTQPAVASIYGWLVFGEVLSRLDILGMVLVGAALAVSRARA